MKILFISHELMAAHLAYLLKKEGHDVKLCIDTKERSNNFTNLVVKIEDWEKELGWVGKEGLIVFDNIGYGKKQDELRQDGYRVFGGCEEADKLEGDREYAIEVFNSCGIKTIPVLNFNIPEAIDFVKNNPGEWVIKQNGSDNKTINYVGEEKDGSDVIDVLESYLKEKDSVGSNISLQKKIIGEEIGVGRYFNGNDWVGPIEMSVEHKKLFPGDLGPSTSEMGTLGWYDDDIEGNKLYNETLAKMKPYLQKIDFRGDMEINCIVNEDGAFPLEPTPRFGSPAVHLHTEIHSSPWSDFLLAIADGVSFDLKWKRGWGLVLLMAAPPFPYFHDKNQIITSEWLKIKFGPHAKDNFDHIHFENISISDKNDYYISDKQGYILYVTGIADTVDLVRENVYSLAKDIKIPKGYYRNDIGLKFVSQSLPKLKTWGYIK